MTVATGSLSLYESPEIEGEHVAYEDGELLPYRLVQPILGEEQVDLGLGGPGPEDDPRLGLVPPGNRW